MIRFARLFLLFTLAMSTAGPNSWGASADAGAGNPTGSTVPWGSTGSPGTPAASSWSGTAKTDYLELTNFGFSLVTGAIVTDISASIKFTMTANSGWSAKDNSIKMIKGGVISGTDQSSGAAWGATITYDGLLWGLSWLYSDFNASNFGIAISGIGAQAAGGGTATLATGTITLTYSSGDQELFQSRTVTVVPANVRRNSAAYANQFYPATLLPEPTNEGAPELERRVMIFNP